MPMHPNLIVKDHSISQEEFTLIYNDELEYYSTHPIPNDLTTYYESEAYISHTDSSKSIQDKIYQYVKKINLKNKINLINSFSSECSTILDVGAGTGDFLNEARKNGWNISGIEPNIKARNLAANKNIQLLNSLDDLNLQKYDVITLWHVLEHIPNLHEHIAKLKLLLKPNGTLIIAVPNFKSYDAKHYKGYWAAFDVPRHLHHFSRNSMSRIFSKYHLSIRLTKPMLFDAYYVSLLSEKYSNNNNNYIKAFLIGFISNIYGFFTKEYSSLIYILKTS
jgi:2-polyprenyl-3-methyl-5-hydroxy-6-metoxy-1,4-benzoquinol methylase